MHSVHPALCKVGWAAVQLDTFTGWPARANDGGLPGLEQSVPRGERSAVLMARASMRRPGLVVSDHLSFVKEANEWGGPLSSATFTHACARRTIHTDLCDFVDGVGGCMAHAIGNACADSFADAGAAGAQVANAFVEKHKKNYLGDLATSLKNWRSWCSERFGCTASRSILPCRPPEE
eukprot:68555-Pyramimonas_sp.AAC.1